MKPLSLKEALEFEKRETRERLRAQNKDSARELILQMMASLPRTPSSSDISISQVRSLITPEIRARMVRSVNLLKARK